MLEHRRAAGGLPEGARERASPRLGRRTPRSGTPWFLTRGNNARSTEKWNTNIGNAQGVNYSASATRDYVYPWTNQWYTSRCNPASFTSPQRNDIDAANANLHAMHNRMHDWTYNLGFTETTYNAQAFNFGAAGCRTTPSTGTRRPAASSAARPGTHRATTRTSSRRTTGSCR